MARLSKQKFLKDLGNIRKNKLKLLKSKWSVGSASFKKKTEQEDIIVGEVWSKNLVASDILIGT